MAAGTLCVTASILARFLQTVCGGTQIEYDESGVTFYYFLVLLYDLFLQSLPMAGQRERSVMAGTCVSLVTSSTTCSRWHGLSSRLSVRAML